MFAGFPRSGLPPRFDSYDDYAETVGWLEGTGAIVDYTRLWWDVRPHPRLGTLEVRVMDVQFDLEYAMALTAYVQALVAELIDEIEDGQPAAARTTACSSPRTSGSPPRYGLDAPLIDLATGRKSTMTAAQLAKRRLRQLAPYARDLGCLDALKGIERMLSWGRDPPVRCGCTTRTATSSRSCARSASSARPRRTDAELAPVRERWIAASSSAASSSPSSSEPPWRSRNAVHAITSRIETMPTTRPWSDTGRCRK